MRDLFYFHYSIFLVTANVLYRSTIITAKIDLITCLHSATKYSIKSIDADPSVNESMNTNTGNIPIKKEPGISQAKPSTPPADPRSSTSTKTNIPPGAVNFRATTVVNKPNPPPPVAAAPVNFTAVAYGNYPESNSGAASDSFSGNNASGAGGGGNDSSGFKRRDVDSGLDLRSPKLACNHDLNGIFNGALKDITTVLEVERNKHSDEMRKAQMKFSDDMDKLKAQHADEIKKIQLKHAAELEAQSESFTRELNKRKSGEQADLLKQKIEIEKEFGSKIELLEAKLACAEKGFQTSLSTIRHELEEQERNHCKATIKNLTELSEKRVACITEQHRAELKAAVSEVRSESQGLIAKVRADSQAAMASLKATLAERDAHLDSMKKFVDSLDNIKLAVDGLATLPQQISSIHSHSASFTSQAQSFQSQIQQLQGFLSAWQSGQMSRPAVPYFWNPGPPPRNCNPGYPPAQ